METQKIKLVAKKEVARDTIAFTFEKPEGFTHTAGQSVDITLINPPETDAEGNTRAFSLVSAPEESTLTIATRMRDTAFKRVLKAMPLGTEVSLAGPFGSFTIHNNTARTAVFLIGGIGITPIYAMIADATKRNLPHSMVLFYSNKTPADAAFLNELSILAQENKLFTYIPTMTAPDATQHGWVGETGVITKEMVGAHASGFTNPLYYLAGPSGMVSAMRTLLHEMGVDNDDIRTEEFSGY